MAHLLAVLFALTAAVLGGLGWRAWHKAQRAEARAQALEQQLHQVQRGLNDKGAARRAFLNGRPCRIGHPAVGVVEGRLLDLSWNGAAVEIPAGSVADRPPGVPLQLRVDGVTIPFRVSRRIHEGPHVELQGQVDERHLRGLPVPLRRGLEQRDGVRVAPDGPLRIDVLDHRAEVLDISATGARVRLGVPIEQVVRMGHSVDLVLRDGEQTMTLVARIAIVEPDGPWTQLGLDLAESGAAAEVLLTRAVRRIERRRAA